MSSFPFSEDNKI